jgi:hypothetical protein
MGGNKVYPATLPQVPADMAKARNYGLNTIFQGLNNPTPAPFDLSYKANAPSADAGAMYKYLLGGTQGGTGGPQPGQSLESTMPMYSGIEDVTRMLKEGLASGFQTNLDPAWATMKANMGQTVQDQIAQAMQDMAFSGSRYGTGAMQVGGGLAQRGALNLASQFAPMEQTMLENAANRRVGLGSLGLSVADLYNNAALQRAAASQGYGQQEFQNTQTMQDKALQEWLRTQPGYGPLFSALMNMANQYPFQAQAPTVTTPWWQDLLTGAVTGGAAGAMSKIIK